MPNVQDNQYRTSDFKIGFMHGCSPSKRSPEAQIRNHLYQAGMLTIHHTRKKTTKIRVIGYEVPLWKRGNRRDECMDLLGYDCTHQPWIIELKTGKSADRLSEVVAQVDRYVQTFEMGVRSPIEAEISQRFLWPDFTFSHSVGKMILADRKFFEGQLQPPHRPDILFCCFSGYSTDERLLKCRPSEVGLSIVKRMSKGQ